MSEHVKPPCVRGCTRVVKDLESGEKIGEEPKLATEGHLCGSCAGRLKSWLCELPNLVAGLDPRMTKGDPYQPSRRGKISGSPALVRLEVEAMIDPRSVSIPRRYMGNPNDPNDPADPVIQPDQIRFGGDVPGVLEQWADCLCDDLNLHVDDPENRPKGLVQSVELLTGPWWSNLTYRPWVDELFTEIQEIRTTLRRLNDMRDPMPVGNCGCGMKLFLPEDGTATIRCRNCGHRLDALSIVRLRAAQSISEAEAG